MKKGIAILLQSQRSDLTAALHGIELARRTSSKIHAIFVGPPPESSTFNTVEKNLDQPCLRRLQFLSRLCDKAGIQVEWHLLDPADDEALLDFIRTYQINCLIAGMDRKSSRHGRLQWLEELPGRLTRDSSWSQLSFWLMVSPPWDPAIFDQAMKKWTTDETGLSVFTDNK